MKKLIRFFKRFFRRFFSKGPARAEDVVDQYVVISYKGQRINLKKSEIPMFNALARSDKRAMALRFKKMEKTGKIRFIMINGKLTCVYNRDYESRVK